MLKRYEEALATFGITSGFVEDQVEAIYQHLSAQYNPEIFKFLSPEYCDMSDKKHQLTMAYFLLCEPFSHYIVTQNSIMIKKEQMIEEISRMIHDYRKRNHEVDKNFIVELVELLVSFKGLHQYVKDVEFRRYSKSSMAGYAQSGTLTVFEQELKNIVIPEMLELEEARDYLYYQTTYIVGHEIEHAAQQKQGKESSKDVYSFLWRGCTDFIQKDEASFSRIAALPTPIFEIANALLEFSTKKQHKKYQKNWSYCPIERAAEIHENNLALTLIEQAQNRKFLYNLENLFCNNIMAYLFYGYDKPLGPTDFYLSRFKQYGDCLQLMELAKSLTLEKRLLLGLQVSNEELESAKINKEKILSGVRKLC
ncbi:MAG: hypothetical protein HFH08_06735 [Bacilli bacterium]|nr:hypothetical protein [Bacilli bacterium]